MELIDDEGRLFGIINIIDALAILLVLGVVAAGTAFVLQSGNQNTAEPETNSIDQNTTPATRYATVNLGTQPSYVAERITEGDNATDTNLTITDVYRIPADGGIRVWTQVKLSGQLFQQENMAEFTFDDTNPQPGTSLAINTNDFAVNGTIHDLSKENSSLPGGTVNVVIEATTIVEEVSTIQQGDTYMVANGTVATMESVTTYPTDKPNRQRVKLGMQLQTLTMNGRQEFLNYPVHIGQKIPFDAESYYIDGRIVKRGSLELSRNTANVVVQTTTSADKAATIEEGDTFDAGGRSLATVKSVAVYPTDNADQKRVVLGLTVETLEEDGNQSFLDRPVQVDQTIPFRTDGYQLTGAIIHRGNTTPPGERTTTTATVKLSDRSPEIADGISAGMVERINDRENARIAEKRVEPATVITESEDGNIYEREHPRKQDVYLTVELDTRRTDTGLYYHGKQLQEGNNLVLDLESITVNGQVIDIQKEE